MAAKSFFSPRAAAVSPSSLLLIATLLIISASLPEPAEAAASGARRRYSSIFSFGDSYADTGNNPVAFRRRSLFDPVARPPYGVTFFGRPTGRECDGRLVIDFIAESLGLPLVPPFLEGDGDLFRRGGGANFAVGGATALDASFFHRDDPPGGGSAFPLNTSLAVQLQWFESVINNNNDDTTAAAAGSSSLFFVGAFGVNDYLLSLDKMTVPRVRSLVPDVIKTIATAIERVITHGGATSVVVPGIIPLGCTPPVMVMYADRDDPAGRVDPKTGCLKGVNDLVTHHNTLLRAAVRDAQAKHPAVKLVYADFFGPVMDMLTSPAKFGFDQDDVFTLCCGGPGKYNYNPNIFCGDAGAVTCKDPSTRLFWDGVHLTEAAYRHVAADWLTTTIN